MKKELKELRKFWKGFNPIKLLRGYKRIVLTKEEADEIFLREHWFNTDEEARVVSNRTGLPFGITSMILNDAEFDVMEQVGLIKDCEPK